MNKSKFCECTQDGFCPRYQREMVGRFREICAGVNCDLGTSAAFRLQWSKEVEYIPQEDKSPTPLLLKTNQAPGDAVVMTAAIYSLHHSHPGEYLTAVESPYPEVFQYNPDVVPIETISDALPLEMHYPAIHDSNKRGIHFMQGWCEFLGFALGIHVPLLTNRPHLYFSIRSYDTTDDYWLICSGGKNDFTNKMWGHHNYQSVVNTLTGRVKFIQVGGNEQDHPLLTGCTSRVGQTNLRELFILTRRAKGIVCGVSLLMHVAAALNKPCIVIAGGREPVQWNAYPKQHYLHTVGMLPCVSPQGHSGACWRSRTVPLGDNTILDEHTCLYPVNNTPKCMTLITPAQVADLVMSLQQ